MPTSQPVVRVLQQEDTPAALDLIRLAWPEIPRQAQEQMIARDPWRARQRAFGAFVNGRLVAQARFHYRPVRLGSAVLNMVGVCEVTTHPDFRRRGIGHRVLRAALDWMRSVDVHFVMLYTGVNGFYTPLGWGTIDVPTWYLPVRSAPKAGTGKYCVSRLGIRDSVSALADIYERSCGRHPISLIRSPEYWQQWPHWAKDNLWFGLLDNEWSVAREDGKMVAYGGLNWSLKRQGRISIHEACALPGHEEALLDLFDDLVARSSAASKEALELNLPEDHALVRRVAALAERASNTSAMVQVVDLRGLLKTLGVEIQRRAGRLRASIAVRLTCALGTATVCAGPAEFEVRDSPAATEIELTPAGLGSLVLGFRSVSELRAAGQIMGPNEADEALELLFPCLHSHYWQIDHF